MIDREYFDGVASKRPRRISLCDRADKYADKATPELQDALRKSPVLSQDYMWHFLKLAYIRGYERAKREGR